MKEHDFLENCQASIPVMKKIRLKPIIYHILELVVITRTMKTGWEKKKRQSVLIDRFNDTLHFTEMTTETFKL